MNYSDYRFSLDINESVSAVCPRVKKGDTVRRLIITLTQNGRPYLPGEDCNAVFRGEKPDGTVLFNECTILGGVITVPVSSQTIAIPGTVRCEISLYSQSGDLLTSPTFDMSVEDTVSNDGEIESSNEYTALAKLIGEVGGIDQAVSDALNEAIENGELSPGAESGKDGVSATHSWQGTVLTVTSASGTSSADLKGEKGDRGEVGPQGEKGERGEKGDTGTTGTSGYTPVKGIDYFTEADKAEVVTYVIDKLNEDDAAINALYGKKIVYDGDSICYGAGYKGGYAKLIADKVSGTYENQGLGGGRLVTAEADGTYHSVVDNLVNLPSDGDLYCFEGGINDYWNKSVLGTYDYTNFDGDLDTTTVCGALETIFRYVLNKFVGKPVCFVITHKIQSTAYVANDNGDTFKDYHDAMVGICEKYSVPYYDAFSNSGLNGWNTAQNNAYLTGNSAGTPDGCHPNEQGYKRYYVPQLVSLFESMMPTDVTEPKLPAEPTYTNLLDEAGYTAGVYLTGNGVEGSDANAFTTGYMSVGNKGTIYLKNVTMPNDSSHGNRVALYDANKNFIAQVNVTSSLSSWNPVFDENENLKQFYFHTDNIQYMRLSAWGIDENSIITANEPIE